jgi:S-DNA-T family DNA segregation ATPase FtsK/SpoIIIE
MANRRLLETQSDRIEMVLSSHKAPARVTGGVVTPRAVQFHLAPALGTKVSKVQSLADELALALGVPNVRVSRQGNTMEIQVPRADAQPVRLLPLMARLARQPAPSFTAVLGLCDDGAPLLMRLTSPDVAHVLISGTTGSGKTALCQTMILSLAMTHRRSQLQLVLVDPKRRAFAPFASLPHLLWPLIDNAADAAAAMGELVKLMDARSAQDHAARSANGQTLPTPCIIVVLDELADLMLAPGNSQGQAPGRSQGQVSGKPLASPSGKLLLLGEHLTRLAQRGREAGIHIIACTQKPSSQVVGTLIRANFPARLVGKVVTPEDARVAAGIGGTGAERLTGRGDFIAVAAGQVLRFKGAYASPAEIDQVVAQMGSVPRRWDLRQGRPSLLHQAVALVARTS